MHQTTNPETTKPATVCPGPTSDAGKAISSRNSLRHGCCSTETLIMDSENIEDFKALEATWLKSFNPASDAERHLVAELVQADWLLQRSTRTYAEMEARLLSEKPNPLDWTEQQDRKLGRFLRYKTAHFNNVQKCRKAIESYRKARLGEKATQEKMNIAQERLQMAKKKANKTDPAWGDLMDDMRKQAAAMGFNPTKR